MKNTQYLLMSLIVLLSISNATSQDWPNLAKYAAENERIGESKEGEKSVVFMGNSITEGWSQIMPEFFEGKPYVNRGISGQTTPQMLIRFRPDVIDLKPDVVVILAGINDIAGNTGPSTIKMIADNIQSMAEVAHANGIKVILSSVLPAYDFPWRPGMEPAGKVIALNKILKAYAMDKGHTYMDYFSSMADDKNGLKDDYGSDGVHPNKKGYQIMADIADKTIEKVMAE